MAQIYEGMFVLDNDVVRSGWSTAKALVTDLIAKHGGTVTTARHWGEHNLAYPINRKSRATYLLSYYELPNDGLTGFVRDLDLSVPIMRYLLLAVDVIPEGEEAEAAKEVATDFSLPEPPRDDVGEYRLWEESEDDRPRAPRRERTEEKSEDKSEDKSEEKSEAKTEGKTEEKSDAKTEAKTEGKEETKEPVATATEGTDSKEEK